jgi:CubicO group peptidase (beta-lactamase class C family)
MDAGIAGFVKPGFEGVRDAFLRNFEEHEDVGAACAVYWRGEPVVDLWGGLADAEAGLQWREDTICIVFSCTKGITAIVANRLIEAGLLDPDVPVAHYWPEFGAAGKSEIPLAWVLAHRAGLPIIEGEYTLEEVLDGGAVIRGLAAQTPCWTPGETHGYHLRAFGWLLREVIDRVSDVPYSELVQRDLSEPLGLALWVGLPDAEHARCAKLVTPPSTTSKLEKVLGSDSLTVRALAGPAGHFDYDARWDRPEFRRAVLPSSNGHCDARSLARLYGACVGDVDGHRLLSRETALRARRTQSKGKDAVLIVPTHFGLGFSLPPMLSAACPASCFGHPGAGGSLGFADAEREIGFGYVMNRMKVGLEPDPRAQSLVEALYASPAIA